MRKRVHGRAAAPALRLAMPGQTRERPASRRQDGQVCTGSLVCMCSM
jgi:hypothetical protein